ncbi:hypothetical protein NHQ30_000998 [Ciborinia camelliae]|nr:hypothetical protein NHQ30_000998 [Ciborinia camelliae]
MNMLFQVFASRWAVADAYLIGQTTLSRVLDNEPRPFTESFGINLQYYKDLDVNMPLCQLCRCIIERCLSWWTISSNPFDSRASDERSAKVFLHYVDRNCYICSQLFDKVLSSVQTELRELGGLESPPRNGKYDSYCPPHDARDIQAIVTLSYTTNFRTYLSVDFSFRERRGTSAYLLSEVRLILALLPTSVPSWRITSSSTGADETFSKIRMWLGRDPIDVEHEQFTVRSKDDWCNKQSFLLVGLPREFWKTQVDEAPLSRRGWVFQERLLAPRNIFFCNGVVLFECFEQRWSEPLGLDFDHLETTKAHAPITSIKSLLPAQNKDNYDLWHRLIMEYSKTDLTIREDRLAAVAGIASRFKTILKDDIYLAGLWLSRLALDMLWTTHNWQTGNEGMQRSPLHQTQLTFSWISTSRMWIRYDNMKSENMNQKWVLPDVTCIKWRPNTVADVEEELFREDIFVLPSVPCVEIKIEGVLKRMKLTRRQGELHVFPIGVTGPISVPSRSNKGLGDLDGLAMAYGKARVWSACLDFAMSESEMSNLNDSGRLFYVPWYTNEKRYYLMLVEHLCNKMGRFRRVGLLKSDRDNRENFYLAPQVDESKLPCWRYDPVARKHTIFII